MTDVQQTDVVMRPQLQAAGADPENAGEELIRFEEGGDEKILCQIRKLLPQIGRFLSRTQMFVQFDPE